MDYNPQKIEDKWQKYWGKNKIDVCDLNDKKKAKFYNLVMFYYPSGDKIHIGHGYNYTGADVFGRYKKMIGFNVLQPIGADAFGLPAENYAIKTGVHPAQSAKQNIDFGRKQLKSLGIMFDWDKEINTSDPEYYKWTQWLFGVLYKNGLAYRAEAPVNWCPSCKTVLANEQVIDGKCERCESEVIQKDLKQWFFKITDYAERLLEDHKKLNWPERTIVMQKNWIGKSEGTNIKFKINNNEIEVFTTRIDTIFGVTALVLAPEHELVQKITTSEHKKEVDNYISASKKKSELERTDLEKEKTGVFIGAYAINPLNNEKIPVWIGDYVIATYGGGAVMFVPAHDERDYEFAKKYNIEIKEVIAGGDISKRAFTEYGKLINSGEFNGLNSEDAIEKITEWLDKNKLGKKKINYHLRDWLISRQRYWGAPIPIIYCDKCGEVLDENLVKLPDLEDFKPTSEGESPLARSKEFVNIKCPKCGGSAKRSTETMDTFVCSSWYFLRYLSPHLKDEPFDKKLAEKWLPVDQYVGGAEHACMHLLYARFITKALFDQKLIKFDEPFTKLNHQGMILAADGSKMSKSKGNVVIPDDYVKKYGADTFRMYVLFIAAFEDGGAWNDKSIIGVYKFLNRVWALFCDKSKIGKTTSKNLIQKINYTIKKVGEDINNFKFNTAIASMMEFVNAWTILSEEDAENFLKILAPFAPHIAEELYLKIKSQKSMPTGRQAKIKSIFEEKWPKYDEKLIKKDTIDLVIQVNGKVRDKIEVKSDISENEAKKFALSNEKVKSWLNDQKPKKVIFVKGKLINIVI
ncbi:leucine--tRNA ligase [Patescibacteria group bacterium]|nr:leucine--tRNA ligase [Patescibacteria group bacterium]MBU4458673.1 leucine--tRNA ligase [Patescibacteria group bacterium]MCG2696268.1 leucine--tRNA ligase [Candidatus Portnoybacteria bacterium]